MSQVHVIVPVQEELRVEYRDDIGMIRLSSESYNGSPDSEQVILIAPHHARAVAKALVELAKQVRQDRTE